jgi:2-dehydro-3-deoxyphosphogluconate aldolase/(4S)-4-hydroxy-2-oxoglutarate aldolase
MSLLEQGGGIIAVIRLERRLPLALAKALAEGGITTLELTLTMPDASSSIQEVAEALPHCLVGAGTVLDPEQAEAAIAAGARFCVSPAFDPRVQAFCLEQGIPYIPGAFTPTELLQAHGAGADAIKLFPARLLGPSGLRDLLAPMPFLRLIPSGGVSLANAAEWIAAGAAAVSVGSALLDRVDLPPATATERARELVTAVGAVR